MKVLSIHLSLVAHQATTYSCLLHRPDLTHLVMSESSADILGLGPNNAFQISLQPDWQIDNGYFNKPIMAHTEIQVHMVGAQDKHFGAASDGLDQTFNKFHRYCRLSSF